MPKPAREFACASLMSATFTMWAKWALSTLFLPEQGIVTAGDCIIGADSHTCTYGALGAFSTGVGSTDMAAGMATGMAWFKVPSAIQVQPDRKTAVKCVSGKDVILTIIGKIGVDGALYKSHGIHRRRRPRIFPWTTAFASANMAIEAGAKNGIFPVDEVTRNYLKRPLRKRRLWFTRPTPDADYELSTGHRPDQNCMPTVACPHLPENTRTGSRSWRPYPDRPGRHRLLHQRHEWRICARRPTAF